MSERENNNNNFKIQLKMARRFLVVEKVATFQTAFNRNNGYKNTIC